MKMARLGWFILAIVLVGCSTNPKVITPGSDVRSYNGTASVGDFLTISLDPSAQTITYKNYTNGETGTVPYTVNADATYSITDQDGNLLSAYEVPGTAMMVEAANAGPNKDSAALITAIETAPATVNTFVGHKFNYIQFRTAAGGVSLGTISIDASGNITHAAYWPFGLISQDGPFNGGSFAASSVTEDASGNFFTVDEPSGADYAFGTQNGFFAVDTAAGTILSEPKAASKTFDPATAGTYKALFYKKVNAQMGQNNFESGTASEDNGTVTIGANGSVLMTDSLGTTMASGTVRAIADTSYIYDGTSNTLSDPLFGMLVFRTSDTSMQDVFVTFQGNAVIFSSFKTELPPAQNGTYEYFYGVGLK